MENYRNPWEDMPTPKGDQLTYIRKGVLWVQKNPHYIVELIKEPREVYVMVYAVHPNTNDNPKKKAQEIVSKKNVFSQSTLLGKLASTILPVKATKKWVPEPPLFVAPIIPNQIATLTGKREDGFFEREPDRMTATGGERKLVRGRNTGVFIGLSSIVWEDGYTIPTESIVKTLTEYKQDLFFDLEGDNNNSGNPLSTYYKG